MAPQKRKYQYVTCYYCGRRTRRDKAIVLYVSPRLVPDVKESERPEAILAHPRKIYVCPACARYRGLSRRDLMSREKTRDVLKKLGIEI